MMAAEPTNIFPCLYKNEKYEGRSAEDNLDFFTMPGHLFRDAATCQFLYFENLDIAGRYINEQKKPMLHSVVNKTQPLRLSLELDMSLKLLDNIVLAPAMVKKIEDEGQDIHNIKAHLAFNHIKETVEAVLEEHYGIEPTDYTMMEAVDHRPKIKYSFRIYMNLAFETQEEYKIFARLVCKNVKPVVAPMVDPTGLFLRMPDCWKDDHVCRWTTPGAEFKNGVLSYTDNCDIIKIINNDNIEEKQILLVDDDQDRAVGMFSVHPHIKGNFCFLDYNEAKGIFTFKRIQPSFCHVCLRKHDAIDCFGFVAYGHAYLGCFNNKNKEHQNVYVGVVDKQSVNEPMKFRWADVREMLKKLEQRREIKLSVKEMEGLTIEQKKLFEEAKKAAAENDLELSKVEKFYYTDVPKFHKKTFSDINQVVRWIDQTIAKIMMGGNSLYITSDFWKGSKHFTEMNMLPCSKPTEAYYINIINPDFDVNIPVAIKNPMTIKIDCKDIINSHTMMDFYKAVDFVPYLIPPAEESKDIFNMFEGYKFQYTEVKETPACVQPWIDHIHNIVCSGNSEQSKTLTQWLAHLIQKPTQKAFATIIYGKQGTGKSILYEFFTRCIGKDLGLQVGKLEDLTQTHNTHVRGKLIINANEATNEPAIRDVNILKGLITETDLVINPKGVNQYTVSNYSRLLITSNYKQCMRLDADDRRYFCLEISDAKKNNDAYFAPLVDSLDNEETQQAFFNYLANYDISDFHHQRPPMSAMKRDMIGASADNIILFMKDVCENEVVGLEYTSDTVEITPTCADVFELYIAWCKNNDEKGRRHNKTKFAEQLKGLFEVAVVRPRLDGGRERRFQINRDTLLCKFKALYMNDNFEYMVAE